MRYLTFINEFTCKRERKILAKNKNGGINGKENRKPKTGNGKRGTENGEGQPKPRKIRNSRKGEIRWMDWKQKTNIRERGA